MEHNPYKHLINMVLAMSLQQSLNGTFSSLAKRNFRLYLIGQSISWIGSLMQSVALAWLVLVLTHSGTALGIVMALQYLPILLLSPWGGVIADRFSKRKLLMITQSLFCILALVLAILVVTNIVQLWMVYVLALLVGLITAVDNPTGRTFIIDLAGKDELRNALTLNTTTFNLARVIGAALGGIIIATIGLAPCFFINAASYFAVLLSLFLIRPSELHTTPLANKGKGQLAEGLRYVRAHTVIFTILIMMFIIGMLTYEFQVSFALLADVTFAGGAPAYGFLYAAFGVGAVVSGLWTAGSKDNNPKHFVIAAGVLGAVIIVASLMPNLIWAMIFIAIAGAVSLFLAALGTTLLQLESAPEMRGRVMSFYTMGVLGSTAIGAPVIGWIGEHVGPRWALGLGGVAAIIACIVGALLLYSGHARNKDLHQETRS
jgi:MFS family permease